MKGFQYWSIRKKLLPIILQGTLETINVYRAHRDQIAVRHVHDSQTYLAARVQSGGTWRTNKVVRALIGRAPVYFPLFQTNADPFSYLSYVHVQTTTYVPPVALHSYCSTYSILLINISLPTANGQLPTLGSTMTRAASESQKQLSVDRKRAVSRVGQWWAQLLATPGAQIRQRPAAAGAD